MDRMWIFGGIVGAAALLGGALPAARAQSLAVSPSTVMASRIVAAGTVDKIDHQSRTMTLRLNTGEKIALNVSPQAEEFDTIKRGDPVTVDYLEAVSISLEPSGASAGPAQARATQSQSASQAQGASTLPPAERGVTQGAEMAHAKPGSPSAPGMASDAQAIEETYIASPGQAPLETVVRIQEITAPVESVDHQGRTMTLRGPDGLVKLHVSSEAGSLDRLKPGDRITTRYTQAMAIEVRKSN